VVHRKPDASDLLGAMPEKFSGVLRGWAERAPRLTALYFREDAISYGELWRLVRAAAEWLRTQGVGPGDKVMIVGENGPQLVALLFAAAAMDAWAVPFNARASAREIENARTFADCRLALYALDASEAAAEHARAQGLAVQDSPVGPLALGPLNRAASAEPVAADRRHDTAVLIFTSGTTGAPKAVMLSHQALMYMGANMALLRDFSPDDCLYNSSPISHIIGFGVVLLTAFWAGASCHLAPRFDPPSLCRLIASGRVTCITSVPTLFARLLEYAADHGISLRAGRMRVVATGGAPLDEGLKRRIEDAFGVRMYNSYGMTECTPIARSRTSIASTEVGELTAGVEVRLVDENGADVAPGEPGEIWVKGPPLMNGYYRNPAANAAAMKPGGFFATGDIGRFDENGLLYIVGRSKDVIIRSGFNVHPAEVESVLMQFPGVALAAVIGRQVEGNEEVIAYVQPAHGAALAPEALRAWCREQLAPYKRPSQIVLSETLPVGATGKILKSELKKIDAARARAG